MAKPPAEAAIYSREMEPPKPRRRITGSAIKRKNLSGPVVQIYRAPEPIEEFIPKTAPLLSLKQLSHLRAMLRQVDVVLAEIESASKFRI